MAHILVIDDDSAGRDLLETLLSYHGHRVRTARDGAEGIALARSEPPDLIITDILMPEMDGYELATLVRADPSLAQTRLMFYSAIDLGTEVRQLAASAGVAQVVTKPADPAALLAVVQAALAGAPPPAFQLPSPELTQAYRRELPGAHYHNVEVLTAEIHRRARAEAQLASIIDSAMDAIITVDENQCVTIWNSAAERMFACPAAAAHGQPLDRFIPARYRDMHRAHIRAFGKTSITTRAMGTLHPLTALRADGTEFFIEASISQVTVDGQQLFTVILRDISERVQAETALRGTTQRLENLSRRLVAIQESERRHLARELHDEIGQTLTGLNLLLEISSSFSHPALLARLREAQTVVTDLTTRVRTLSLDLRPSMLDDLGLLPTLLWHFERYTAQTQVHVTFKHSGLDRSIDSLIAVAAYRVVQEALTNVARYAEVAEVLVAVWIKGSWLVVSVEDQGRGFDLDAVVAMRITRGLAGMRERIALLDGHLMVDSTPGQGARVLVELPLDDDERTPGEQP
jgi:two-component system sensor kinase